MSNKKSLKTALVAGILGLGLSLNASAALNTFSYEITTEQAVPLPLGPLASVGAGTATYDTISNLFSWNFNYLGMSSPVTAIHFHGPALPGATAPFEVNVGMVSGLGASNIGSTTISPSDGDDLAAGLWYINIHTVNNPAGEIRGQVNLAAIPEPSTFGLFCTASMVLIGVRRFRNRS